MLPEGNGMQKEYLASAEEVLEAQSTSADAGLAAGEAASRLASVGPNKLKEEEKDPALEALL